MIPRNVFLVLLLCAAMGCGAGPDSDVAPETVQVTGVDTEAKPWTRLEAPEAPGDFRFVVVSDRTGEHREGVFSRAMPKINLVSPDFVVSVGDLIEGYTEDPAVLNKEWSEIESNVNTLRMPFFYTAGNHDMSNETMALEWQRRFGPSYYSFTYQDVHFLVLNSELFGMVHDPRTPVPGPWTQADQLAFAEQALAEQADARWTFVLIHQPVWDGRRGVHPDWVKVEDMLGDRGYTVFAGHTHDFTTHVRNTRQYITLATTGGGSGLRGIPFGEFDHVAHVTMTDEGPVIANLMLDGIRGSAIRTAAVREVVRELDKSIQLERMVGTGDRFEKGSARFTVANTGKTPLEVVGDFAAGPDLRPTIERIERVVAAGSVAEITVPYVAVGDPKRFEALAPAEAQWTLGTRVGDTPVEINKRSSVHPEADFPVSASKTPIKVDGKLGEWASLPFKADVPGSMNGHGTYHGSADASFRFGVAYDENQLYVAVDVRDDSVVAGSDVVARMQDHVSISIDSRPDPERSANEGRFEAIVAGTYAKLTQAMIPLGGSKEDELLKLFGIPVVPGVAQAAERTGNGYAVEFSVPRARLDEIRGSAWDALRINVGVVDFDDGEAEHVEVYWRPDRFGGGAPEGSGTFVRR